MSINSQYYILQVDIVDPKEKKEKEEQEMATFWQIMSHNNSYENFCIVVGTCYTVINVLE